MIATEFLFDEAARLAMLCGVEKLSKTVRLAFGSSGQRAVVNKHFGAAMNKNDGLTYTKEVDVEDFEAIGARLVHDVASKTSDIVGDGATTATLLAESIYRDGLEKMRAGANPTALQNGINKAVEAIGAELARVSMKVKSRVEMSQVATLAAKGDSMIGEIIAEAMEKVGTDGTITVEEGKLLMTHLDVVKGMQLDSGYLSPYFVTDAELMEVNFDNAYVLIYEKKIKSLSSVLPVLDKVSEGSSSLLIIAEDVEGEALATLVVNKVRGTMQVAAVKVPGTDDNRKEVLEDIAVLIGSRRITDDAENELANITIEDLGKAKHITIDNGTTTIIEGAGTNSEIQTRINKIRCQIEETTSDYNRERLRERLIKLSRGVAVINVGAATESEMKEKMERAKQALQATRAAIEEGVVPGGGVGLIRAQKALDALVLEGDEAIGVDIVRRAVEAPLFQLANNAGQEGGLIVQEVKKRKNNDGYNIVSGEYVDLIKAGIVDPTKVTRTALQNAASVSGLLLTAGVMIIESPETMTATWHSKSGDCVEVKLRNSARQSLLRGGEKVAHSMRLPTDRGRAVVLEKKFGSPVVQVAGNTATDVDLGPYETMGAHVVREIVSKRTEFDIEEPPSPHPPEYEREGPPPQRYLVARADGRVKIDIAFTLMARISTEHPNSVLGESSAPVAGEVTGNLKISIYAPGFTSNDGTQREIAVPATGNSSWAGFELVARKLGVQPIEVIAWKNSVQVGGVTVSIDVGAAQPPGPPARGVIDVREPEHGEYTLEVVFEKNLNKYQFQLRRDIGDNWPPMYSEILEGTKQTEYSNVIARLNTQARNLNSLSPYAQGEWLKGMGATLYNSLIPSDLKQALWENRNRIKYLHILSANEPMPWELLLVSDPAGTVPGEFIADSATVTRWRYGPPATRQFSKKSPYFILPTGSPTKAQNEVAYACQKLGTGKTIVQLDDLLKLLNTGQFSLLHFASHNVTEPKSSDGLYIPFGGAKFDITFAGAWSKNQFRSECPLVFMNSCTSGGAVPLYTEMAGWADRFLAAGCGAFIGALWEIRDTSALAFAQKFYDQVAAGNNLGDSMRAARNVLQNTDPTHLAYTLYGNPLAHLV